MKILGLKKLTYIHNSGIIAYICPGVASHNVSQVVTWVFAHSLHRTEETCLALRVLLEKLVDRISGIEGQVERAVLGCLAALIFLESLGEFGAGGEHLFDAVTIPISHDMVAEQQCGRRCMLY